ncbi:MAG: PIN domain-containing protein [Fimbriimonadales bacterium]|nr:PIN domain-containing protein [Fimbriimonadales bacterium]
MSVFVDTSAWLAIIDADDLHHTDAQRLWAILLQSQSPLYTTNYVLVEAMAIAQRRFGMNGIRSLLSVASRATVNWITEPLHQQSLNRFLAENRRRLSFVDCTSFIFMQQAQLQIAFAYDPHFAQAGFQLLSEDILPP